MGDRWDEIYPDVEAGIRSWEPFHPHRLICDDLKILERVGLLRVLDGPQKICDEKVDKVRMQLRIVGWSFYL